MHLLTRASAVACALALVAGCGDKKASDASDKPAAKRTRQVVNAPAGRPGTQPPPAKPAPRTATCGDVAAKAAATWNATARAKIKTAFSTTGVAHADGSFDRVVARLDAYKKALDGQAAQKCRYVARLCLQRRLGSMAALVAVLMTASKLEVDRALRAAYRLPRVADCADTAFLDSRPRPPKDIADKLERLYEQLDRLRVQMQLGRIKQVEMELKAVAFAAQRMNYPAAMAEANELQARAFRAQNKLNHAQQRLRVASQLAARSGDAWRAASVWIELVSVLVDARRTDVAFKVVKGAEAALARSTNTRRLKRRLREAIAMAHYQKGKYDAALEAAREALALVDKGDDIAAAQILFLQAAALQGAGKLDEAEKVYARLRDIVGRAFGSKHPMVGRVLIALGRAQVAQKHFDAGIESIGKAIAAFERSYGDSHLHVATARLALARALFAAGKKARARASAKTARKAFEKAKSKAGVAAVDKLLAKLGTP